MTLKTIAVREKTFRLLKDLKKQMKVPSFDKIVFDLVVEKKKVPASMFGELEGKAKPFTTRQRNKLWQDPERE